MGHHVATLILIVMSYILRYVSQQFSSWLGMFWTPHPWGCGLIPIFLFKLKGCFSVCNLCVTSVHTPLLISDFIVNTLLCNFFFISNKYTLFILFHFLFFLISVSCRFARVGSVVLALHDASDVFLEVGKMSKYRGSETTASISFVLFVLSWIILRLIYYPFWILRSTRWE